MTPRRDASGGRPRWRDGWWAAAQRHARRRTSARGLTVSSPGLVVLHSISLPPGVYRGPAVEQLFGNTLDCERHPYFAALRTLRVSAHFLVRRDGQVAAVRVLRTTRVARRRVAPGEVVTTATTGRSASRSRAWKGGPSPACSTVCWRDCCVPSSPASDRRDRRPRARGARPQVRPGPRLRLDAAAQAASRLRCGRVAAAARQSLNRRAWRRALRSAPLADAGLAKALRSAHAAAGATGPSDALHGIDTSPGLRTSG
jgi:hypothetical protein